LKDEDIRLDPTALLSPVPVAMVSCRDMDSGKTNIITLAWIGVACSEPPTISAAISPKRHSYEIIRASGEFVVNLVDKGLAESCDYCGVRSGRDVDKFQACGLEPIPAEGMKYAPAIAQSPLSLSCRVVRIVEIGSHDLFLGEVVGIRTASRLMDESGRLRLDQADLVAFNHGEYFALGNCLGFFGFSVARPKVLSRRMPGLKREKHFD